jgi:hypothetical protein
MIKHRSQFLIEAANRLIRSAWRTYNDAYSQYGTLPEYASTFEAYSNSLNSAITLYNDFNATQAEFDAKMQK